MKQTVKFAVMLIAAVIIAMPTFAQGDRKGQKKMNREELAKVQANHIARELAFDEATTARFVDTYSKCQQEIWELRPQKRAKDADASQQKPETVGSRLERSQKILDIRKKYYAEYSKFLTEAQIERVYEIEKSMMSKLAKKRKNRNHKGAKGKDDATV